ncbi:MAG: diadenylate cyclase CdaA [Clostridia bacterium]|nr:diadenylate cyclase CdaA [Clostridia bacterium]
MNQYLINILAGIDITDIIDILIMTFLVYKILGFIRSSRAEQLAKGLVIIILAAVISGVCHFYVVNWMLEKVLSVGLIALVVVFQPELRRALEYLGRGKFASKAFSMDMENIQANVDMIVRAVDYFSGRKEGAIIVIERETALLDISETGTIMDCKLSEEALENIFYKGSPLHDGAAIIRSDRILAAGCVLPLTSNPNLSKDLGTRHRAGIGITEVSDAVAVMVSEETGIISMAVDGKLNRFLDLKAIEKFLLNMYLNELDENQTALQKVKNSLRRKSDGTQKNA